MKTEVISFRKDLIYGFYGELTIKERLKASGRVSEVRIRFYPGQERSLRINPYILHKGNRREDLVTFANGGENYFSGDNDYFVFPVSVDFENDDELVVYAKNHDTQYYYTVSVDVIVNYFEDEVIS